MRETTHLPEDEDYAREYLYATDSPITIARAWADAEGGFWIESNDGQHISIPFGLRRLVAKRVKEATFR